jgi:hypothetical protein
MLTAAGANLTRGGARWAGRLAGGGCAGGEEEEEKRREMKRKKGKKERKKYDSLTYGSQL